MKEANEETDEFALVLQNAEGVKKEIYFDPPEVKSSNAILEELETFADAIENDSTPIVPLAHATEALGSLIKSSNAFNDLKMEHAPNTSSYPLLPFR